MPSHDHVRIFLKDIALALVIGVYEAERHAPQNLVVNLAIEAEALPSYNGLQSADLNKVIDYDAIYHFVQQDLPRLAPIALLETVAEHIATFCLRDPRARKVTVRLDKLDIYPGTTIAGIELIRHQRALP